MDEQWYVTREGKRLGPVSREQLQGAVARGELRDTDMLWREGLPGWLPLPMLRDQLLAQESQPDALAALGIAPMTLDLDRPNPAAAKPLPQSYPMPLGDRLARAAFVAVAVGLAWGIRGDFGHLLGAMYPGAVLLLALAYVSGQDAMLRSMPLLALVSALGIGLGGNMSYGLLHGYAQSDTFNNYAYGFLSLFLEGGSWGFYGGALVGLVLERDRANWLDWAGGLAAAICAGLFLYWLVYVAIGFDINPPRSNDALAHLGGAVGVFGWLLYRKRPVALRASLLGFVGFGLGMSGGRLVGNIFHNMEPGFTINHWNTMEVSCGLIGGFVVAFGMLGMQFRERESDAPLTPSDIAGAIFVLGLIPLLHRLTRVSSDIPAWGEKLQQWGSSWTPDKNLMALNVIVLLGLAGAGVWLFLQWSGKDRWYAFPVLWLSFVMLLFQNFFSLHFFEPPKPGYLDMHNIFWVLFLGMAVYVGVREYLEGHSDDSESEEESDRVPWKGWSLACAGGLALTILIAGAVNGPTTMSSAATRWPVWVWNQKPEAPAAATAEGENK